MSISFPSGRPVPPSNLVTKKRRLSLSDDSLPPRDIVSPRPLIADFADLTISERTPPAFLHKPNPKNRIAQPDAPSDPPDMDLNSLLRNVSPFPYKLHDGLLSFMPPPIKTEPTISRAVKDQAISFTAAILLSDEFQAEKIKQQNIGDCYLLAAFDALRHSPAVFTLLNQIKIQEILPADPQKGIHYIVRFPSGLTGTVKANEIGEKRGSKEFLQGPWIWQLLELTYAKATRSARNKNLINPFKNEGRGATPFIVEGGNIQNALYDMLVGIPLGNERVGANTEEFSQTQSFIEEPGGYLKVLELLSDAQQDANYHYILGAGTPLKTETEDAIDLLTQSNGQWVFSRFPRNHAFSIRSFDMKKHIVTVADPHDTANKVYTLNLVDFCTVFSSVSGIRIPKNVEDVATA